MVSFTYENVVDLIRNIANAVNPTGTFVHARRSDGSLEYAGEMPQIHLYPFNIRGGDIKETDLLIAFWEQDSPATSNEEREEIIRQMDVLQRTFIETLDDYETVQITNLRAEPQYRQLAGTLSGYAVTFTLSGGIACDDTPIPVPPSCPTLCERISDATADQIENCLSDEQAEELSELLCGNATAVLKNTEDTTLSTTSIAPSATANIIAPDATAVIKNTANTTLITELIASGDSENITAPDATAVVKDQDGNTLDTEAIPSGVSEDIVITLPRVVELYFAFEAGDDTSALATNAGTTWTLTAISNDGSSGTITVSDNGAAYAAFVNPTTTANGETIQVKRTTTTGTGWVLITGTYA